MSIILETARSDSPDQERAIQRKILKSKMESLNMTLQNLLQKKIRIDLEIKRTKKKLSKLKNSSQTYVKTTVELEGFDYDLFSLEDHELLKQKVTLEAYSELVQLDEEVLIAERLIQEAEEAVE